MSASQLTLVGRGSSKDLYSHPEHPQHVFFQFSDRVSVFDYGPLPELITGRGLALKRFAIAVENIFAKVAIPSAYDSVLSQKMGVYASQMAGRSKFSDQGAQGDLEFIPLEVIFRLGVPEGSSLLKRRPEFEVNQRFEQPLVEFSTKLEARDRILQESEAEQLAGGVEILKKMEACAIRVAKVLAAEFKKSGLDLWDGKIELALNRKTGDICLVDAVTPDELRLSFPGMDKIPLSKELIRQWLGATLWSREIAVAKERFHDNWKAHVAQPPRLGAWRERTILNMYESLALVLEDPASSAILKFFRNQALIAQPKVFVAGGGGREAALKWRLRLEGAEVTEQPESADAILISQDADLARGLADEWRAQRYFVSGASKAASRIEWSKEFGREVATLAGVPVPKFSDSFASIREFVQPPVIKCDGLAAGKGVVVAKTFEEAERAFQEFSGQGKVLVEERLSGVEASAFFYIKQIGTKSVVQFLGCAQDFKRRFPGDEGPNTGGMGARTPHPDVTAEDLQLFQKFAEHTNDVLLAKDTPYEGVLYLGLMKDQKRGWHLIEYNARPGDPETQVLLMSWPDDRKILRNLLGLCMTPRIDIGADLSSALCVAMVRPEYPAPAPAEFKLPVWDFKEDLHADLQLFRNSSVRGRVAYVAARGPSQRAAADLIFGALIESPWKDALEWRADLLP